jgi:hypothetical protein
VTPLTPFPITPTGADPVLADDFTAWASNGWVATGDAVIVDCWEEADGGNAILLFVEMLGFWGNNPGVEQSPGSRSTRLTKVYGVADGLSPNRFYIVRVGVAFYAQDFGAAGKWVGMEVNGVQFAPDVAASGTITPTAGFITGYGRTDSAGDLTVAFGCDDITVSCDLHIQFDDLEITTPNAELADIFYDAGVLYISGNAISISRGGISFDPQETFEPYEIPGTTQLLVGMEELVSSRPVLRTTLMLTGEYQFTVYRPDGTWADHASIAGARTYTPTALRTALSTGVYLQNVIAVWPRARGDYIAVEFPYAVCRKYGVGSKDKDEGEIPVEIEARIPLTDSAGDSTYTGAIFDGASPGYLIHTFPGATEF